MKTPPTLDLERQSSALTLSDMELFVFPELIYSLMLANLMSPRLWRWRDDPWFDGIQKMKPYRRVLRLKQYIMDHYAFNLDLDTWGLTTKPRELARFEAFIDTDTLRQSNALFGYEGDKYYFDIDIRTHFGLDKYAGDVIPYWKTETVEAMDAFRFKAGYTGGAGECVSLAVLYAAALFIVCRIPLRDLFLMATPLHSQNFVDAEEGILTNNRRLVTKAMWFNGTAISAQARRALENERVTLVAHESGVIHLLYPTASIDPTAYGRFTDRLHQFLRTALTGEILGNFLRHRRDLQRCFLVRWPIRGVNHYLNAERAFAYEQDNKARLTDHTRDKLLAEIDSEEFQTEKTADSIVLNDLETYIATHPTDLNNRDDVDALRRQFSCGCLKAALAMEGLLKFCHTQPRLPDLHDKLIVPEAEPLGLTLEMGREEILRRLEAIRTRNRMADLAFYAYRDLNRTAAAPFLLAALERNPVSVAGAKDLSDEDAAARVAGLTDESIYDGAGRLAQPDEVWNYGRGDGVERAVLLANLLRARHPAQAMTLRIADSQALLVAGSRDWTFPTGKQLKPQTWEV